MKNHKIITCASYGGTGSSAITDLLGEIESCKSLGDYEFTFLHYPDGILDLEYNLIERNSRLNTGYSIYKFEKMVEKISKGYKDYFGEEFYKYSKEYINSLIEVRWLGGSELYEKKEEYISKIKRRLKNKIYKLLKINKREVFLPKDFNMYYSIIDRNDFYSITKKYMNNIFKNLDLENKYEYIAIDQLVPSSNIDRYLNYFEDLRVIVVDRDPRDLYILNRKFWNEGWIPEDINVFIKWFKLLRFNREKEIEKENKEKILRIQFEDLIYNYENEIDKIFKFLEIDKSKHKYKKKYLNPEISINNTKLYLKNKEYTKEIELIEKELEEYCYFK